LIKQWWGILRRGKVHPGLAAQPDGLGDVYRWHVCQLFVDFPDGKADKLRKERDTKTHSIVCNRVCRRMTSSSSERFKASTCVFSFITRAKASSKRIYAALPDVVSLRSLA
jgi:hypothetical protein